MASFTHSPLAISTSQLFNHTQKMFQRNSFICIQYKKAHHAPRHNETTINQASLPPRREPAKTVKVIKSHVQKTNYAQQYDANQVASLNQKKKGWGNRNTRKGGSQFTRKQAQAHQRIASPSLRPIRAQQPAHVVHGSS